MDVVRFKGGLGNQMFQYAFAEALRTQGREVKCNLGFYRRHPNLAPFVLKDVFENIELNEISDEKFEEIDEQWREFKRDGKRFADNRNRFFWVEEEKEEFCFQKEIFETRNCTFVGYWQTEKYFFNCQNEIRRAFAFHKAKLEEKLICLGNELRKDYVGVHVRRGDYVGTHLFDVCTMKYYREAMSYFREIFPTIKFIFFSDDKQWIKEHFMNEDDMICDEVMFDEYRDWYDMYLMTQCVGNIIANSTFSWWGAWLNQNKDSLVIAPKQWLNNRETPDIWCKSWIRM